MSRPVFLNNVSRLVWGEFEPGINYTFQSRIPEYLREKNKFGNTNKNRKITQDEYVNAL